MRRSNPNRGGSHWKATAPISFSDASGTCRPATGYFGIKTSAGINRAWRWAQLVIAYGLLEVALWTTPPIQPIFALATAAWIVGVTIANRRSLRQLGLGTSGFGGALIAVPIAAVVAALILVIGWQAGTLRVLYGPSTPVWHSIGYALWALEQQFILQSFFFVTLEELLNDSKKALLGATFLFCAAHIPNPVLMATTLVAALFFVSVFRRYRNIYPLGLAHAMLGLSLAVTLPDHVIRHMRVGISYLHFILR
jgi:hypothetical protein